MKPRILCLGICMVLVACRTPLPTPSLPPPTPTLKATRTPARPGGLPPALLTPSLLAPTRDPARQFQDLQPLAVGLPGKFAALTLPEWAPASLNPPGPNLPVSIATLINSAVTDSLTNAQRNRLSQNGFVVIHSQEPQFSALRSEVSQQYGQPYYLTTDAAYHALHLSLYQLLPALEAEELRPGLVKIIQATLQELEAYRQAIQGTELQADARLASAYLAVGLFILDPQARLAPDLAPLVLPQFDQIRAAAGQEESRLIPGYEDDFRAYIPPASYSGDPDRKSYFVAMTWFTRARFTFSSTQSITTNTTRAPLLITLALRRAPLEMGTAASSWIRLQDTLAFLFGPGVTTGPAETAARMDSIYGRQANPASLEDPVLWQGFLNSRPARPPALGENPFNAPLLDLPAGEPWTLFSAPYPLDRLILENLGVSIGEAAGQTQHSPTGLDLMAALGSPQALQLLKEAGVSRLPSYQDQLASLKDFIQSQTVDQWLQSVNQGRLYAIGAQLAPKNEAFPPALRTGAWGAKDLNSAMASWAAQQQNLGPASTPSPGTPVQRDVPQSGPAPGYVEPNPQVFFRLGYIARALSAGLEARLMIGDPTQPYGLQYLLPAMQDLGDRLNGLGQIAARELAGEPLNSIDYDLIQAPLGIIETWGLYQQGQPEKANTSTGLQPSPAGFAALAEAENQIQYIGTGLVDRIYVIVPLEGGLEVAQGGILPYMELSLPGKTPLTSEDWQTRLLRNLPIPGWAAAFILNGGQVKNVLAFRAGDVYQVTPAGDRLTLRSGPAPQAQALAHLQTGAYLTFLEGPVRQAGFAWWRVQTEPGTPTQSTGWVQENPAWFQRAWGQ